MINIACIVASCWLLLVLGRWLLRRHIDDSKILVGALVVGILGWLLLRPHIGVREPGHWFERGTDYQAETMVNLFPDDSAAKNYRLPGTISAVWSDDEEGGGRSYYLDLVRFPNGGMLRFESANISLYGLERVTDANGRHWRVEIAR